VHFFDIAMIEDYAVDIKKKADSIMRLNTSGSLRKSDEFYRMTLKKQRHDFKYDDRCSRI
jgi:hypothetical protein